MRLINTHTGKFEEFVNADEVPQYAILSHTWDEDGEQTYQEVLEIQGEYGLLPARKRRNPPGKEGEPSHATSDALGAVPDVSTPVSEVHATSGSCTSSTAIRSIWDPDSGLSDKVRTACGVARRDGYHYIWIDSCCINKESSSELSEAINSMFNWYRDADVCYAFLMDVPNGDLREDSEFRKSRWFKRGWTLQELVAPLALVFLSQDWQYLGSKMGLAELIKEITFIDIEILTHNRALSEESVANRMQWASRRKTTRVEDQAYSLLGIFGITMPTLYGEGENAFRRLQEQILERIPDHSIFAWGDKVAQPFPVADPAEKSSSSIFLNAECTDTDTLLAPSPRFFRGHWELFFSQRITRPTEDSIRALELPLEEYTRTPYGVRTQLCLLPLEALNPNVRNRVHNVSWYLVVLRSQYANDRQRLLCRLCYMRTHDAQVESLYLPSKLHQVSWETAILTSLFTLPIDDISRIQKTLKQLNSTVYLPHPKLHDTKPQLPGGPSWGIVSLSLPTWTSAVLQADGYMVTNFRSSARANHDSESSFSFVLSNEIFKIHIHYRCMKHCQYMEHSYDNSVTVTVTAQVWILSPGEEIPEMNTRFQLSPPYTAVTWADYDLWRKTLPAQDLHLTMDSGESTTLRLGLRLKSLFQYDVYVDFGSSINSENIGAPFYPHLKESSHPMPPLESAHKALNLILTGSARRALDSKGFSAHLVLDPSLHSSYGSHTLTLTSTDTASLGKFAIVVKYFHAAQNFWCNIFKPDSEMDSFVIVARITLESGDIHFQTVQDGPYFVQWINRKPWKWSLEQKCVVLTTPDGTLLTLQLGLDLAWNSEYYLNISINFSLPDTLSLTPRRMLSMWKNPGNNGNLRGLANWGHSSIRLTLTEDDRRALQAQGYQVYFEALREGDQSDGRVFHRLTLSQIDITIIIEYFHNLTTHYPEPGYNAPNDRMSGSDYPFFIANPSPQAHSASQLSTSTAEALVPLKRCNQQLTFQASVWTLPLCSIQKDPLSPDAVPSDDTIATVVWDAKRWEGWMWALNLRLTQIIITSPSGHRLMLWLDLHFGWLSEYYLTVEIDPLPPLPSPSPSQSNVDAPPVPDSKLDATAIEDIWRLFEQSTEDGQSEEAHDEPPPGDPRTRIPTLGSLVKSQEGARGGRVSDPDSRSYDDPLPGGPSAIDGSQGRNAEPEIVDVADDETRPADPSLRTTPEGSSTGNQGHTEGGGGGGVHDPYSYSHDGPLPPGPSTIEGSHRVRSVEIERVESPGLEKRSQLRTEVVEQGDAEQVSTHPALAQSETDKRRAGERARRYGAKLRRMAQGTRETIQRGVRLLKGQTRI